MGGDVLVECVARKNANESGRCQEWLLCAGTPGNRAVDCWSTQANFSGLKVEVLKPSGPDRFRWIKKLMAPFFWIMGVDVLYMQIAFRVVPHPMKG